MLALLLLIIPLFAFADWLSGSSVPLPGRQLWWASALAAIVLAAVGHFSGVGYGLAAFAAGFLFWRSFAWKVFGGKLNPVSHDEIMGTLKHHSIIGIPAFVLATLVMAPSLPVLALVALALFFAWAFVATELAVEYGKSTSNGKDIGPEIDVIRGTVLGIIIAALALLKMVMFI